MLGEKKIALRFLGVLIVVAAFVLTIDAVRVRSLRSEAREAMRIGIEDVARRVRTTSDNLATVIELNNKSIIAKARAFANIIAKDPSILADHARFASFCQVLDVEELHVSDERGILIQSVPSGSIGFDMNSAEQPRPFMRAITDKSFEMVQDPSIKPTDGKMFQYAGVARLDQPGIVQVGHRAERVAEARRLADIDAIATSTRIGRDGRVEISKLTDSSTLDLGFREECDGDGRRYVLAANVGAHRVVVTMPIVGLRLADDWPFLFLCLLDVLIVLVTLFAALPSVKGVFKRNFHSLAVLFGGDVAHHSRKRGGEIRHLVFNPVTFACGAAFVCTAVVCWFFFSHSARVQAEDELVKAAADLRNKIDMCVDQQLFYQGNAICKNYGSPEAMSVEVVKEIMRRYDIDELNVIDSRGVIISGDLAEIGFEMASNPNSAKFNRLLNGVTTTYSQPFRGAIENPALRRKYAGIAFPAPAKGYIQIGFAESRLKDGLDYWFADVAHDWHIGKSGFFIVAKEETGEIDSCGKADESGNEVFKRGDTLAGIGFDASSAPRSADEFFTARLYGEDCLCLTEVRSFHRCIAALPLGEISGGTVKTVFITIAVLFGVFVLVAVFMTRLSDLVASLKMYIADAARQVEREMAMAKDIQTNALPSVFPPYPEKMGMMDIFARMIAAKEVGGDFYDFYFAGPDRLALIIADVSGKGVPAALFMMRAKATLQGLLKGGLEVSRAVAEANDRLAEANEANMFVTAWIGVVDLTTGHLDYVNAGHNPPVLRLKTGECRYLVEKSGPPLAVMEGIAYRAHELQMAEGESILLYTDGVTEATNRKLELYGEARLLDEMANQPSTLSANDTVNAVVSSVNRFAAGAEQADDITILSFVLRHRG